jgi:hypothetical protein
MLGGTFPARFELDKVLRSIYKKKRKFAKTGTSINLTMKTLESGRNVHINSCDQ